LEDRDTPNDWFAGDGKPLVSSAENPASGIGWSSDIETFAGRAAGVVAACSPAGVKIADRYCDCDWFLTIQFHGSCHGEMEPKQLPW
jgi:hypothetical protein